MNQNKICTNTLQQEKAKVMFYKAWWDGDNVELILFWFCCLMVEAHNTIMTLCIGTF